MGKNNLFLSISELEAKNYISIRRQKETKYAMKCVITMGHNYIHFEQFLLMFGAHFCPHLKKNPNALEVSKVA